MIYCIWALTMIIPAVFALRGERFDRRPKAAVYGLLIGLTGACANAMEAAQVDRT